MWACPKLDSLSAQGMLFTGGVNTASPQAAVAEAHVEVGRAGSHSAVIAVGHKVGHTLHSQVSTHKSALAFQDCEGAQWIVGICY